VSTVQERSGEDVRCVAYLVDVGGVWGHRRAVPPDGVAEAIEDMRQIVLNDGGFNAKTLLRWQDVVIQRGSEITRVAVFKDE